MTLKSYITSIETVETIEDIECIDYEDEIMQHTLTVDEAEHIALVAI